MGAGLRDTGLSNGLSLVVPKSLQKIVTMILNIAVEGRTRQRHRLNKARLGQEKGTRRSIKTRQTKR